jgi:signal peptidase I
MNPSLLEHRPWLALLMSLVLPGYGQLYNGALNKAIWIFLSFAFSTIPLGALIAIYLPDAWLISALAVCTLASVAVWVYGMVDAWREAKQSVAFARKSWQVSGMYLAALVFSGLFTLPLLYTYVRGHWIEPFRIPSNSMAPGILSGDFLIADKGYNCPGCKHAVKRGDIAIFVYPNDRTQHYIKRIVGLPGDRVQMKGKELIVSGQSLKRSETTSSIGVEVIEAIDGREWRVLWSASGQTPEDSDVIVPPGHVLVLGDARMLSKDSRVFGTVPLQDVVGRARQLWFSSGPEGVRWYRLGKVLQ